MIPFTRSQSDHMIPVTWPHTVDLLPVTRSHTKQIFTTDSPLFNFHVYHINKNSFGIAMCANLFEIGADSFLVRIYSRGYRNRFISHACVRIYQRYISCVTLFEHLSSSSLSLSPSLSLPPSLWLPPTLPIYPKFVGLKSLFVPFNQNQDLLHLADGF